MQAESIYGEKIDLDEIQNYSKWIGQGEHIQLISKDGTRVVANVPVHTLIICWIEKEAADYAEAQNNNNANTQ